jgi:hypothetical protein
MVVIDERVIDRSLVPALEPLTAPDERAARGALRDQISGLERRLCDLLASAFPHTELDVSVPAPGGPRVLSLGELECVRDDLADRLASAQRALAEEGRRQAEARVLLERMLLEPGKYRTTRLPARELGEGGCGVYQVVPRLGIIGMLAGWWHVKLSSGCPLPARVTPAAAQPPPPH